MRRRNSHLWALAAWVALCVVLAFAGQTKFAADSGAGMSAPSAPKASVESAPAAKLLQSHFGGCGLALLPAALRLTPSSVRAIAGARRGADSVHQCYGPLYRRPPPNFS